MVYFSRLLVTTGDFAIKDGNKHYWVFVDMDNMDKIVIFLQGGGGFRNTFTEVFKRPCWRMRGGQVTEVRPSDTAGAIECSLTHRLQGPAEVWAVLSRDMCVTSAADLDKKRETARDSLTRKQRTVRE